tara:strand:- start:45057 stop:45413 length:357 start_codon:yes stop_codon:yes gene_type:complete
MFKKLLKKDIVKVPLSLLCLVIFLTPIYINAFDYKESFDYDLYYGQSFLKKINAKDIYKKIVSKKNIDTHLYVVKNYKINSYICLEAIKSSKNKLFNECLEAAEKLVSDEKILKMENI